MNENNHFANDSDNDGETGESGYDRSSGVDPWKKVESSEEAAAAPQVQEPSRSTATSATKLYVSPAMRAAANAVSISSHCSFSLWFDDFNELAH